MVTAVLKTIEFSSFSENVSENILDRKCFITRETRAIILNELALVFKLTLPIASGLLVRKGLFSVWVLPTFQVLLPTDKVLFTGIGKLNKSKLNISLSQDKPNFKQLIHRWV